MKAGSRTLEKESHRGSFRKKKGQASEKLNKLEEAVDAMTVARRLLEKIMTAHELSELVYARPYLRRTSDLIF